jgi:hypothetical protein
MWLYEIKEDFFDFYRANRLNIWNSRDYLAYTADNSFYTASSRMLFCQQR